MSYIAIYNKCEEELEDAYNDFMKEYDDLKKCNYEIIEDMKMHIDSIELYKDEFENAHIELIETIIEEIKDLNGEKEKWKIINNNRIDYLEKCKKMQEIQPTEEQIERKNTLIKEYNLYKNKYETLHDKIEKCMKEVKNIKEELRNLGHYRKKGIFTQDYEDEQEQQVIKYIQDTEKYLNEQIKK